MIDMRQIAPASMEMTRALPKEQSPIDRRRRRNRWSIILAVLVGLVLDWQLAFYLYNHQVTTKPYVFARGPCLVALDQRTGNFAWYRHFAGDNNIFPIVTAQQTIVEQQERTIAALDNQSGNERWHVDMPGFIVGIMADDRAVGIVTGMPDRSEFRLYDAVSGHLLWSYQGESATMTIIMIRPIVVLHIAPSQQADALVALRQADGAVIMQTQLAFANVFISPSIGTTFADMEQRQLFVEIAYPSLQPNHSRDVVLAAYSLTDGTLRWQYRLAANATFILGAGEIDLLTDDPTPVMVALNTRDGQEVWRYPNAGQALPNATYRFLGSRLVALSWVPDNPNTSEQSAGQTTLAVVDLTTHSLRWSRSLTTYKPGISAIAGQILLRQFTNNRQGTTIQYASFDLLTGGRQWETTVPYVEVYPPMQIDSIQEESAIVLADRSAMRLSDGTILWRENQLANIPWLFEKRDCAPYPVQA